MRIAMIAINDPAGTAITFANAINRLTPHTCRLITKELRYNFAFEKDLHLETLPAEQWDEVEAVLAGSDIFHFHMTADEDLELGPFKPRDFMRGKRLVHHHHGHPDFRGNPEKYQAKYRALGRDRLLVSTPDLLHKLPGATWMPNMVPLKDPLYLPMPGKRPTPVRVAHSPTRKDLKNTDLFMEVMARVGAPGKAETVMIENTEHRQCLRQKRGCHILFDHLQGYFGVSSLEALSQGLAVVAGLDDWNQACVRTFAQTDHLPWVISSPDSLERDMRRLVADAAQRDAIGAASRRFMESHWTQEAIVARLVRFYEQS
ncbi:MAG: glycosyltransferase [Desulfovibrionaceae bacterium]